MPKHTMIRWLAGMVFVAFFLVSAPVLAEEDAQNQPGDFFSTITGAQSGQNTGEGLTPIGGVAGVEGEGGANAAVGADSADSTMPSLQRAKASNILYSMPSEGVQAPGTGVQAGIKSEFGISLSTNGASWSAGAMAWAYRTLKTLPATFRNCTKDIRREYSQGNILGYVYMGTPRVHMLSLACSDANTFCGTLVHEMTHCFQAANPRVTQAFRSFFYPNGRRAGRSVSSYGNTQMIEDMAECGRAYWAKGALMKRYYPSRYEFMKRYVFNNQEFLQ